MISILWYRIFLIVDRFSHLSTLFHPKFDSEFNFVSVKKWSEAVLTDFWPIYWISMAFGQIILAFPVFMANFFNCSPILTFEHSIPPKIWFWVQLWFSQKVIRGRFERLLADLLNFHYFRHFLRLGPLLKNGAELHSGSYIFFDPPMGLADGEIKSKIFVGEKKFPICRKLA